MKVFLSGSVSTVLTLGSLDQVKVKRVA